MHGIRFTDEFKRVAVGQVVDRGYSVAEVSERLGISANNSTLGRRRLRSLANKSPRPLKSPRRSGG